jgi:arylsulfatase A-like enzyme
MRRPSARQVGLLYTGFHQVHASLDGNNGISDGFRSEDVMTLQVIAAAGYRSAIFGKWVFGVRRGTAIRQPCVVNQHATAHDLRRSFGFRCSRRVM